jgi:hypoxanthine-DNA glycosylase
VRAHSFPPIAGRDARILILGTMPGKVSLRERQYYAHPQNAFWKITAEILGFDPATDYHARTSFLRAHGIALWDVLKSCTRASSADSDIDESTLVANDFRRFFATHASIRRVCFNGAKAEALYTRHVHARLARYATLERVRLPSTSPANASVPWPEKLRAWRAITDGASCGAR